ncbi:hypothetical protein E2C01_068206 [Portunus trituberculatus]|uniref:Uncharacterized protein n=1 Tax=Portunus trituberculatus TaxID=210409 RepID=A0A5B7HVW9_PORTR|nr:hypothetical protein [Portunus trituberculatus]
MTRQSWRSRKNTSCFSLKSSTEASARFLRCMGVRRASAERIAADHGERLLAWALNGPQGTANHVCVSSVNVMNIDSWVQGAASVSGAGRTTVRKEGEREVEEVVDGPYI